MGIPLLNAARRACVLVLAAAFASCAPSAPSSAAGPSDGSGRHPWTVAHTLRYATGEDIVGLNPHLAQQLTLSYMGSLTMAWLVKYDRHNRPVPELATAVPSLANHGVSRDGKTITYHLRRDAKWSDGVPFTSADVAFSAAVVQNPKNNEGTHLGFDLIERVDTPDPYTVVFHLSRAYSGFYVNFFSSGGANPCVLPKHLLADRETINDAPYNALPVGIGPFKYESWKRADSVVLVPDPLYFGRKPKLRRVIFKIIPDRNTTLTQLTAHEIDLWLPVPAAFADRVRTMPAVHVIQQPSYGYNHIDFEMQHGALRDVAVRRALRLATDRATILAKIRHGVGILQETPFSPGHPFYVKEPLVPYDLQAANALLDAGGWKRGADGVRVKNGQRLEFTVVLGVGTPDNDAIVEQVRLSWGRIGARFDVKHYPSPVLFAPFGTGGILYTGKFDVAFFAWITNPNGDLTNLFACDRVPPKGQNIPRYCDRAVDAAMERVLATNDPAQQYAAQKFTQEALARDVPTIVTEAREDLYAFNDDLHDFHPNQVTAFDNLVEADI